MQRFHNFYIIIVITLLGCSTDEKPASKKYSVAEQRTMYDSLNKTTVNFEPKIKQYGTLTTKEPVVDSFEIRNVGNHLLKIYYLDSRCDCIDIIQKPDSIATNSSSWVKYRFTPRKKGFTRQSIVLVANCQNGHYPYIFEAFIN